MKKLYSSLLILFFLFNSSLNFCSINNKKDEVYTQRFIAGVAACCAGSAVLVKRFAAPVSAALIAGYYFLPQTDKEFVKKESDKFYQGLKQFLNNSFNNKED